MSMNVVREGYSALPWFLKLGAWLLGLVIVLLIGAGIFRVTCVTFVDSYQLGYLYDARDGSITRLGRTGYFVTWPLVQAVHTVDLRPMQVRISANSRVLNAKLVQFDPNGIDPETGLRGLELFLSWHGRDDYDAPVVSSSTTGTTSMTSTPFSEILTAYAYEGSGKSYSFLVVIRELKTEEVGRPLAQSPPGAQQ